MPNKLDGIKDKKEKGKVKVYLEDVDITAIAMTSGTGACSQMNDPYILKSKDLDLTEDQIEILKKIGEYDKLTKQKKEDKMDEDLKKEMETKNDELQKKLDDALELLKAQQEAAAKAEAEKELLKVEKSLDDFEIENKDEVSTVLVKMEEADREIIVKALFEMKAFEIEKKIPEEENELKKKLSKEEGADGDAEVIEKDINERISAYRSK